MAAVLSVDPRALAVALSSREEPAERPRSRRPAWPARLPMAWRAVVVVVSGDVLLLLRSPRRLVQAAVAGCLPAVVLLGRDPSAAGAAAAVLLSGYLVAVTCAEGARRARLSPALDAVLPLDQVVTVRARILTPALVMIVWAVPAAALLGWRWGAGWSWLVLLACLAPAPGAGAVRAAYRPVADFTAPVIDTPLGGLPPGLSATLLRGPDVALFGSVPALACLVAGEVAWTAVALQLGFAVAAVWFSSWRDGSAGRPRR